MSPHDGPDGGAQWPFVWPYVGNSWIQVIGIESSTMRAHSITEKRHLSMLRQPANVGRFGSGPSIRDVEREGGEWIIIRMRKEKR